MFGTPLKTIFRYPLRQHNNHKISKSVCYKLNKHISVYYATIVKSVILDQVVRNIFKISRKVLWTSYVIFAILSLKQSQKSSTTGTEP